MKLRQVSTPRAGPAYTTGTDAPALPADTVHTPVDSTKALLSPRRLCMLSRAATRDPTRYIRGGDRSSAPVLVS